MDPQYGESGKVNGYVLNAIGWDESQFRSDAFSMAIRARRSWRPGSGG